MVRYYLKSIQKLKMSAIYDNWERLVDAALKKQQLWELFHAPSSSSLSEASDFSSSSQCRDQDSLWQEEPPKLIIFPDYVPLFAVEDVRMTSAVLIGKGTFGNSYSVAMNNGEQIAVKKLKIGIVPRLDFKRKMAVIGRVRHMNVAPLRGYYACNDERVLLYDHYGDGSVYALLHGPTSKVRPPLSWRKRVDIMICVARAIAGIHKENGGTLVHGNIKATNVLLSPTACCCVSELGLANMIETTFSSGVWCNAPEVKTSKDVSQASDVYNFGILLFELLTRKSSVHVPGGPEAIDLVKFVRSKSASQVIHPDLWYDSSIKNGLLAEVLEIGIRCVAKSVKKRPQMSEVVQMLEGIHEIVPFGCISEVLKDLVFFGDTYPKFWLAEMLRSEPVVLRRGTYESSYKSILENGITIDVKRLRCVVDTENGIQEHEWWGENDFREDKIVAKVTAYDYSKDEKLVLCHYYSETSLSALLHGPIGYEAKVLDWQICLKIAMDVGTAIAHIHGEGGRNFVPAKIKSSRIFFGDEKYAILSDVGYSIFTVPFKMSSSRAQNYYAPELKYTRQVSQASDVYSFGVLLVKLASHYFSVDLLEYSDPDKWLNEVLDEELLGNLINMPELDVMPGIVQFLRTTKSCVNYDPCQRPAMPHVVQMLKEIPGMPMKDIDGNVASVKSNEVEEEWQPSSIETRLENLLLYLLPTMTP